MAHLTIKDRTKLELMLKSGSSLSKIAKELKKANSTISREIKKHTVKSDKVHYHRIRNRCILRKDCQKKYVCNKHYSYCKKKVVLYAMIVIVFVLILLKKNALN